MTKRRLQARLEVATSAGATIGDARIRLLEAVDRFGSISKAARHVPMSYKTAWDALDDLDNLADQPVIARSTGGSGGGGTTLTDYGRKMVAMFRAVEGEYQSAIDTIQKTAGPEVDDKAAFRRLLRRVALRTSARNQFACVVTRIVAGPVNAQVFLSLDEGCEIEAQVTTDAIHDLSLATGQEVVALVKAPAVFLLANTDVKTSVNNHLTGVVSRIQTGSVNAEVVLDLPLKRTRHVTSVVTMRALESLALEVGSPATAAFQATSLILATLT